ncbi:Peroxiredoxin-2E [Hibiscus syriacus]|uniref:Glutaredoxin-dependent peroxiredoxin n=1 Tax=Hibiscus syriacus TaxID=106335 RepID=A0A6A3AKG0_HIBSY|nr:peroxiredoxin-2E, chloroplastic-like [Hibiscus syriacus]KAE8704606.1 Peroxiredoxin-2E [Hibiscus syriacus]
MGDFHPNHQGKEWLSNELNFGILTLRPNCSLHFNISINNGISRILSSPAAISFPNATTGLTSKSLSSNLSISPLSLNLHRRPSKPISFSTKTTPIYAAISVGEKLPDATLSYLDSDDELQTTTISSLTAGRKAVLFAVPGAFTPTCSQKHLPGFVEKSGELKAKGFDTIACISVNDAFVMKAWKENLGINDEVLLLSDGNGKFTKKIGCEMDLSDKPVGLGVRSRRYALLAEDGIVKLLNLEEGGAFTFSGAEDILKVL